MERLQIDDPDLSLAARAALDGGTLAKSMSDSVTREEKADATPVTEADHRIDRELSDFLRSETDHSVLSEESGDDDLHSGSYWVVDPIDGTQNYAYGQPMYGTAVGLIRDDEPSIGCFYMPEMDHLFYAVSGAGAYLNEQRVTVTQQRDIDRTYIVGSGIGSSQHHEGIAAVNPWIQRFSSALQAQAFVAAGWTDAGVFGTLKPWDVAAGTVLVREAGGIVKRLDSGAEDWASISGGGIVMTNPELATLIRAQLPEETTYALCSNYDSFSDIA